MAGSPDAHPSRLSAGPARSPEFSDHTVRGVFLLHVLAAFAAVPWLFSWSGLGLAVTGVFVFGTLGINIGYHRLLTHRGFECPRWLEHLLVTLGACCLEGSPINWVAVHRLHHQHSDKPLDPHSPRHGLLWSHMGWFLAAHSAMFDAEIYVRYARDLFRDRFYKAFERPRMYLRMLLGQALAFMAAGSLVGGLRGGSVVAAIQLGLSWIVWGVFVRTIAVWHITWATNSLAHVWGYRNFETPDDSRNSIILSLLSNGEGWHNNHHARPRSAVHGLHWWELDATFAVIRMLEWLGLAWNVIRAQHALAGIPGGLVPQESPPVADPASELGGPE